MMTDNNLTLKQPLITILVVSYNSEEFILETLESARLQTYRNIELIISDDGSTDNTLEIVTKWLSENTLFFKRTELVTSNVNTGIPSNFNRGLKVAAGEWIKGIAGDDLLTENCIENLLNYISTQNEKIKILSADIIKFSGNISNGLLQKNQFSWFCSKESTAFDQYQMLLRSNRVFASTVIIKRELLELTNGYDERFRLLEDWPQWIKLTHLGYKIYHLNQGLVYYRYHANNLSQTNSNSYMYNPIYKIDMDFRKKVIAPQLSLIENWGLRHRILGIKLCFSLGNNKKNLLVRLSHFIFESSNPLSIFLWGINMVGYKYKNTRYF
jgi:glycosyltransferase involved in cell wall biosynthesis